MSGVLPEGFVLADPAELELSRIGSTAYRNALDAFVAAGVPCAKRILNTREEARRYANGLRSSLLEMRHQAKMHDREMHKQPDFDQLEIDRQRLYEAVTVCQRGPVVYLLLRRGLADA